MKLIDHWFWSAFSEHRRIYYRVFLAAALVNFFAVASTIFIMVVYDRVIPNSAYESLYALTIGMAIVLIFDFVLKMLRAYFIDYAGEYVDKQIGDSIFDRLLEAPTAVVTGPVGATANTFKEFDQVREFFTSATLSLVVDLPFIFFFIFVIYLIAGPLAIVPLVAVPVVDLVKDRWRDSATKQSSVSRISRSLAQIAVNTAQSSQQICLVGIVFYGVFLVSDGTVSMGAMVAAVLLSSRTLAPLGQIAGLAGRANNARTAYQRLSAFMEETKESSKSKRDEGAIRRSKLGTLEFVDVKYRYPDKEVDTLRDMKLKINEGEKVAILGRNGSGKSTLVKLACGLFTSSDGIVSYDGMDINQIHSEDISKFIGIVLQDVQLFSGSVKENITMGRTDISEEDIVRAGKISGVEEFIGKMPGGYDLVLSDRGMGLSGGQRQAIAIARAIVCKPTHYILDEPTSAMDMNSEQAFIAQFNQTLSESTLIVVSHRMPLLNLVSRIIVMNEGQVVDDGPREEILNKLRTQ